MDKNIRVTDYGDRVQVCFESREGKEIGLVATFYYKNDWIITSRLHFYSYVKDFVEILHKETGLQVLYAEWHK